MYSVLNKLSEYIYFSISKRLLQTLLLLVFKIVENLQCILKRQPHEIVKNTQPSLSELLADELFENVWPFCRVDA